MKYFLNETIYGQVIRRSSDLACIPVDEQNRDYVEYLAWLAEGNTPEEWNPETTQPESEN